MPYKIAGQPGTWYEPGTRKGNGNIAWRGQLPDGKWTEIVTDSRHQSGAQAHVRRVIERWHRSRPPASGAEVDLETAAHHYKAAQARSDVERDRVDRVVKLVGPKTVVRDINQTHLTAAAKGFRDLRAKENAKARAERRQTFPPPSTGTINREVTTPLRGIVNFAAEQGWCSKIVLRAVKAAEGEVPSPPRPAARDDDVGRLLRKVDDMIVCLKPVGRRQLNYRRQLASLKAIRALVTVVHQRGYRISEWLRWDWTCIDLQAGMAKILLSKPPRWVEFDLSPQAVAALAEMPAQSAGRVFPWGHRSQVYQAIDRLGVRWRPHESRRAVVTAIIRSTGDPALARDYVGHASIKTTMRYRVVDQQEVRTAVRTGGKPARSGKPGG